jgi:hypothetical protein
VFDTITSSPLSTLAPLNVSHIVLIPKRTDATTPADYRPTSIVHGVQRILSKSSLKGCNHI